MSLRARAKRVAKQSPRLKKEDERGKIISRQFWREIFFVVRVLKVDKSDSIM
jgi:hypothetical protein